MQKFDEETKKLRAVEELQEGQKNIDRVLHYQEILFILEII